jgi:hypothetical protein
VLIKDRIVVACWVSIDYVLMHAGFIGPINIVALIVVESDANPPYLQWCKLGVVTLYPRYRGPPLTSQQIWTWHGSLLRQMAGEPNTPYQIWPHLTWLKGRDHQPKKNYTREGTTPVLLPISNDVLWHSRLWWYEIHH